MFRTGSFAPQYVEPNQTGTMTHTNRFSGPLDPIAAQSAGAVRTCPRPPAAVFGMPPFAS
jgi:hypothetical protein